ncbi:hypothetical protein WDU94_006462 [Cyamophila willieti]
MHCFQFESCNLIDLMYHCRACTSMPRVHPHRDKFMCYACYYSTYISTNMKNHIMTHTGSKPYNCSLCTFKGASSQALKYHVRSTHVQ